MIAFRPVQKSLLSRLVAHPGFQIVALALVIASTFVFVHDRQKKTVAERIAEVENAGNTQYTNRHLDRGVAEARHQSEMASINAAPSETASSSAPETSSAPSTLDSGSAVVSLADSGATGATSSAAVSATGNGSAESPSKNALTQSVQVSFSAVSRAVLMDLMALSEPRSLSSYGPVTSGVLPRVSNRLRSLQTSEYFESLFVTTQTLKGSEPVEIYAGQRDETSGQFLGFVLEVTPLATEEGFDPSYRIRAWHYLREGGGTQEFSVPLPESFSIAKGSGAFIAGALAVKRNSELERRLYDPIKVLHILATEPFRNGQTELFITIEPR